MTGSVTALGPAPGPQAAARRFQLDAGSFGDVAASVNLFQGNIALPLALADVPGPGGLDLRVTAQYQGTTARSALTWNQTAPTGLLGAGWSLPSERITVDGKTSENPLDGRYFLQSGGVLDSLVWYGSDGDDLLFECATHPLWQIRYVQAAQTWYVVREDGSTAVYGGEPGATTAVMYGLSWGNWIGASRTGSPRLRRYPVAWNLAALRSAWGTGMTWAYDNDEVEVVDGLAYTRAAYITRIAADDGRGVAFFYEHKQPGEYVPPHQTKTGLPEPAYQDRYETRALARLDVLGGPGPGDLAYSLSFGYELADVTGSSSAAFTKRYLTEIRQERSGRLALPPTRFSYQTDPDAPNPGGLTGIVFAEGGTATVSYADVALGPPGPSATTAQATDPDDVFRASITVPRPLPGAMPLVFQGPDYVVIAWYAANPGLTRVQVYCAGGRWSQPWTAEISGQVKTEHVRFAAAQDFFALYLPTPTGTGQAFVHLFRKKPYRFGEWIRTTSAVPRSAAEISEETVLRAGQEFAVLHLGGETLVHRFWWNPVSAAWQTASQGRGVVTRVALAAHGEYYIVAWYDSPSRRAQYQIFHLAVTGAWQTGPVGSFGEQFDWTPGSAGSFWALGDSFAIGTYALAGSGLPRLRILEWEANFAVARDQARDGKSLSTVVTGAVAGNGPLLLRYDGVDWRSFEFGGTGQVSYAYGEDLAVQSVVQGSVTVNSAVAYDPTTRSWSPVSLTQAAGEGDREEGTAPAAGAPATAPGAAGAPGAVAAQPWPPSSSGRLTTAGASVRWRTPQGALTPIGSLPAVGAPGSLHNVGPSYLVYQDDPTDRSRATTTALLFHNGQISETVAYRQQRIADADPRLAVSRMAGPRVFVTYPAAVTLAEAYELYLHRIHDQSLADRMVIPVATAVEVDSGYTTVATSYTYDTERAVLDSSGTAVFFPRATRVTGPDGQGGRSEYSFHNGLPDPAEGPDQAYSLLTGMIRETHTFDADGFEVAATRAAWTAHALTTGAASPVGVMIPVTQALLAENEATTGKLRLFGLPLAQASALDAGVISPAVRAAFAEAGLPLAQGATAATIAAGAHWVITSEPHSYPVGRPRDAYGAPRDLLEVYGAIRKSYTNLYDQATGLLTGQRAQEQVPDGTVRTLAREITPAWRVPAYAGMLGARMLAAAAQERITDTTAGVTISATVTTYRDGWPAPAPSVWAEWESWTWRGDTPVAPPFDYAADGDRAAWLLGERVTARNRAGEITVSRDVMGMATSTLFDNQDRRRVATLVNTDIAAAVPGGCYLGFEPYERHQGWVRAGGQPLDTLITTDDPHTGSHCLRLAGGEAVTATFELPAGSGAALFACWVRTAPGYGAGQAAWTFELRPGNGGPGRLETLPVPATGGTWQRLWLYLDPPAAAAATAVTCQATNPAGAALYLDDVRFAPLVGGVTAAVFAGDSRLVAAMLDANNAATRIYYDAFLRPAVVSGPGPGAGPLAATAFGRGSDADPRAAATAAGADGFDPANPNAVTAITPAGAVHVDDFGRDAAGRWRARWEAAPADAWSVTGGVLRHHGEGTGTVTLRDSGGFSWYGARADIAAGTDPAAAVVAATVGDVTVRWNPAGQWELLRGTAVVAATPGAPATCDWMLAAQPHTVVFLADGRQVLAHRFAEPVGGALVLTAGAGQGFGRLTVFHRPAVNVSYTDGVANPRQAQDLTDDGVVVRGTLPDELGRPSITVKGVAYPGAVPGYRPGYVTGPDPDTGQVGGDVAAYYSGGERSDDQGYPYDRQRLEAALTGRPLETGQPGLVHAIAPGATHTTRTTHGAKVADGFLDHLPPGTCPATTVTDPDGRTSTTVSDVSGRVLGTRLAAGTADIRMAYDYDVRGTVSRVYGPTYFDPRPGADPQAGVTVREHDGLGQVIAERSGDTGVTETVYDDRGQVRFMLYADGRSPHPGTEPDRIVYHRYDILGRHTESGLAEIVWDRAVLAQLANTDWPADGDWRERLAYDGDGSVPNAVGQSWTWTRRPGPGAPPVRTVLSYDEAERVIACDEREGEDPWWRVAYAYHPSGLLERVVYPHTDGGEAAAPVVCYGYDVQGRMTTIGTAQAPQAYAAYGYTAAGTLAFETLGQAGPAPATRRFRYNSPGLVTAAESARFTERVAYWEAPGADGVRYYGGRASQVSCEAAPDGGAAPAAYTWLLAYGPDGRLRTARNTAGPGYSFGEAVPAQFDANGNLLAVTDAGSGRQFGYDPTSNRLASADGATGFGYDASGQTTTTPSAVVRHLGCDRVSGTPTWVEGADGARLHLVTRGQGTQRWSKTWTGADGSVLAQRHYLWGGGAAPLTDRVRGAGGGWQVTSYVYGIGGLVAVLGEGGGAAVFRDRLGSSRLLTGSDGTLLGRYDYGPFGGLLAEPAGSDPGRLAYRFLGQEWDPETGLLNLHSRLYSPGLYRFYATDPAGGDPSPYAYAGGDPVNLVDPQGEFFFVPLIIAIAIGATAGAVAGGVTAAATGASTKDAFIQAAIGAGVGAVSGALSFGVGSGLASLAAYGAWNAATTGARYLVTGVVITAVSGAVDGAATGAGTQIIGNLADGKRGNAIYDGAWEAAVAGAVVGAAVGAVGATFAGGYTVVRLSAPRGTTVLNASLDTADRSVARFGAIRGERNPQRWDTWGDELPLAGGAARRGRRLEIISHGQEPEGHGMIYRSVDFGGEGAMTGGQAVGDYVGGGFRQVDLIACYLGKNSFAQDFAARTGTFTRASAGMAEVGDGGVVVTERFHRMLVFHPSKYKTGLLRVFGF
jgi:RHS repeat-associated protein